MRESSPTTTRQAPGATFVVRRRNRFWEVLDPAGTLVCITVYKCGALEVARRLEEFSNAGRSLDAPAA